MQFEEGWTSAHCPRRALGITLGSVAGPCAGISEAAVSSGNWILVRTVRWSEVRHELLPATGAQTQPRARPRVSKPREPALRRPLVSVLTLLEGVSFNKQ